MGLVITRMLHRVRAADFAFLFGEGWAAGFLFPSNLSIGDTVAPVAIDRVTLCGRDFVLRLSILFLALTNALPFSRPNFLVVEELGVTIWLSGT